MWAKTVDFLNDIKEQVLITSHLLPDGDALGSMFAVKEILKCYGIESILVNESHIPNRFKFLNNKDKIYKPHELACKFKKAIILDCGDIDRIGRSRSLLVEDALILNIDHHATNTYFGQLNIVNEGAAATCQLIFEWINFSPKVEWSQSLATMVYTGLVTDTGGFRHRTTTGLVLRQAAKLIDIGVNPAEIAMLAMDKVSEAQLKLLCLSLSSMERYDEGRITALTITKNMWQASKAEEGDEEGLVSYARNVEGSLVGVLFWERAGLVKISLRSFGQLNVGAFANDLGGGGHLNAAGCTFLNQSLEQVKELVLRKLYPFVRDR
ncbi:MAG: hypothetical protein RLZ12_165 [Bacillota bacterium]|jgi:phosphoesterase RecJ-like protein